MEPVVDGNSPPNVKVLNVALRGGRSDFVAAIRNAWSAAGDEARWGVVMLPACRALPPRCGAVNAIRCGGAGAEGSGVLGLAESENGCVSTGE